MAYCNHERKSTCIICGNVFVAARSGPIPKACPDPSCQNRYVVERRKASGKKCRECKEPIYAKALCRRHYALLQNHGNTAEHSLRTCKVCGTEIRVPRDGRYPKQVCDNPECLHEHTEQKRRIRYIAKRGVVLVVCNNPECGIEFERPYKQGHPTKYCSTRCARRRRGAIVRMQRWLVINPGLGIEEFRAAIKFDRGVPLVDLRTFPLDEVIARDHGICYICKEEVTERGSSGRAATRDHVKPLAVGGEHSWENIRLAHRECNSRKNVSLLAEIV